MYKLLNIIFCLALFFSIVSLTIPPTPTYADDLNSVFGQVEPPEVVKNLGGNDTTGAQKLSTVIRNIINIVFVFAGIAFLFMIIWGGFSWITSGGDKEGVSKARARITQAIIGLVILSLAFLIVRVIGTITKIQVIGT